MKVNIYTHTHWMANYCWITASMQSAPTAYNFQICRNRVAEGREEEDPNNFFGFFSTSFACNKSHFKNSLSLPPSPRPPSGFITGLLWINIRRFPRQHGQLKMSPEPNGPGLRYKERLLPNHRATYNWWWWGWGGVVEGRDQYPPV